MNNHFGTVFTSENLNNVPEFNLPYRKKIEASMIYFKINEQVIIRRNKFKNFDVQTHKQYP